MWQSILIAIHTAAGVIAFAAGWFALRRRVFGTIHLWSLITLMVSVTLAVILDWTTLATATRIVFVALIVLAGYLVLRAVRVLRSPPATTPEQRSHLIDLIGFNLVALFDGFVVILALDLGAPAWLIAAIAVAGVVVGHLTIRVTRARTVSPSRRTAHAGRPQRAAR